jgi:hypothetical protein
MSLLRNGKKESGPTGYGDECEQRVNRQICESAKR